MKKSKKYFLIIALAGIFVSILACLSVVSFSPALGQALLTEGDPSDRDNTNQGIAIGLLRSLKKVKLDLKILKNQIFLGLVEYGRKPTITEKGRPNPFAAY